MKLKKIKAFKAINAMGEIIETLSKTQAYQWAGQGGLVKNTFVYGGHQ